MTPKELKGSILSLAVQGKLVEQRGKEGTSATLYQQLKAEKQKQIKAGKLGKSKSLVPISEDDYIFEIPESWVWIKIGDISAVVTKGTTPRGGNVSYLDRGIGFLRAENVAGYDKLEKSTLKYIDEETHTNYLKRSILRCNDILVTIAGTLGRTAIVREEDLPLNANQAVSIVRLVNPEALNLLYLVYALNSPEIQKHLTGQRKITAIPNLTLEIIENCVIPLPPLAEQKRIVAKIEEMLPYIDRYEQAWSQLEDFNKRFPTDMQKSILQMAIQGKLVEQHPQEGTGEEPYQQIQAEKQRLIKEGTIKKRKPLPEITEDEKPFDIPESWRWVHIGDLFQHNTGKALNSSDRSGVPLEYITTSNVYWNRFELDKLKTMLFTDAQIERCSVKKGDLLVLEGGDIGRAAIWNYDFPMCIQNHIHRLRPYDEICIEFFYYVFFLYKNASLINGKGIGIKGLSTSVLHKLVIPLPPLAEQKRIVAKLEEILPLCEKLK